MIKLKISDEPVSTIVGFVIEEIRREDNRDTYFAWHADDISDLSKMVSIMRGSDIEFQDSKKAVELIKNYRQNTTNYIVDVNVYSYSDFVVRQKLDDEFSENISLVLILLGWAELA